MWVKSYGDMNKLPSASKELQLGLTEPFTFVGLEGDR